MGWFKQRKVSPLPVPASPMMLAATLLDKVQQGQVESCVVLVKRISGVFEGSYSTMTTTDILMHEKAVQKLAMSFYDEADQK